MSKHALQPFSAGWLSHYMRVLGVLARIDPHERYQSCSREHAKSYFALLLSCLSVAGSHDGEA